MMDKRCRRKRGVVCLMLTVAAATSLVIMQALVYLKNPTRQWREDVTDINVFSWLDNPFYACRKSFIGYGNKFAVLYQVRFDKSNFKFAIPCEEHFSKYTFVEYRDDPNRLNQWMKELQFYPFSEAYDSSRCNNTEATFVLQRVYSHNLYHTMCEWYNIFLIAKLLKLNVRRSNIILLDDKPPSLMDSHWNVLFANLTNYKQLHADRIIPNVIWTIAADQSPLYMVSLNNVPYLDEFTTFFVNSFGAHVSHSLNCSRLYVTIIWRRDYISHQERLIETNGSIYRKIKNEQELKELIVTMFPQDDIKEVILEEMSMKEQLERMTQTDILFGMHGAAMTHILFLPKHAGIFETFPNYSPYFKFFKAFSRWRGVKYLSWRNKDPKNEEKDFYTTIPPAVVQHHLNIIKQYMCPIRRDLI